MVNLSTSFIHDIEVNPSILGELAQGMCQLVAAYYKALPTADPGVVTGVCQAVVVSCLIRENKGFFSKSVQAQIDQYF
jgi:hypothetical protein